MYKARQAQVPWPEGAGPREPHPPPRMARWLYDLYSRLGHFADAGRAGRPEFSKK